MTAPDAARAALAIVGPVPLPPMPARPSYRAVAYGGFLPPEGDYTWLEVDESGRATAYAGKVEYGQSIRTGFAVEVADELRLPLASVEVVLGDTERTPWDMGTFGSQSTNRVGLQLRKAAATARQALLELAADRLDLPVGELEARDGRVASRSAPERSVSYADLLAGKSLQRHIPEEPPLTQEADFTVMGRRWQRPDALARVTGRAVYSQDISVPGMLFARIIRPPSYGAELLDAEAAAAEALPGVHSIVRDGHLLAVLAEDDETAELGARLVRANWHENPAQPGRWEIPQLLVTTAEEPIVSQEAGSLEEGFRAAAHTLEATYYIPYVSNAPMEPRAAVAQWEDGRLTIWAGTQRPFGIRAEAAGYFGVEESRVRIIAPEIGGGFGGKSIYRPAIEAARLAKAAGRPVRVGYTRTEETTWSTFRPAALIEIKSGFDGEGRLVAWDARAYHAAKDRPQIGVRGSETPYDVANVNSSVSASEGPLPAGSYRSLGGATNHFAREVHMDEIAATLGIDPVELRLRNLSNPRYRRVLETAAEQFGWPGAVGSTGRGIGVAIGLDVGSYAAECVELDVQGSEVKVRRVTAALDCGLVVNPEGAINQVEGSIVMGLGTALYEAAEVEHGQLLNPGFMRYRVPRINNAPAIDVHLVGDAETPSTGAGEPGIVPIAAAIANAVFDSTGKRLRELPLQRQLG